MVTALVRLVEVQNDVPAVRSMRINLSSYGINCAPGSEA